jgi:putative transposase
VITETLGVSRSNQYERRKGIKQVRHYKKAEDERYLALIRKICDKRPTYGYRRLTAVLNRTLRQRGEPGVNHKRVYRIMKINNLLLQKHTGRPVRLHEGTIITPQSNTRWCSDVFEIICWNGEKVRVAFCMDCADREVLSYILLQAALTETLLKTL